MSVALLSARIASPGKQKKHFVWSLWVAVRVTSGDESRPQDGEAQRLGTKVPSLRRRRSRFRRGSRGKGMGARTVKRSKPTLSRRLAEKRPLKEAGSDARRRHFVASFERSVEKCIKCSQQCLDIKRRAEERRSKGQKPALPPRAEEGLLRRQTRLRKSSDFWGKAYSRVMGVSHSEGRRCWRDLLFSRSLIVRRDGVIFGDAVSVMDLTDIIVKEQKKQQHFKQKCRCPKCGVEGERDWFSLEGIRPPTVHVSCPNCRAPPVTEPARGVYPCSRCGVEHKKPRHARCRRGC